MAGLSSYLLNKWLSTEVHFQSKSLWVTFLWPVLSPVGGWTDTAEMHLEHSTCQGAAPFQCLEAFESHLRAVSFD